MNSLAKILTVLILIALNIEFFYTVRYGNHENVSLRIKPERREDIFLHKWKFRSGMVQ